MSEEFPRIEVIYSCTAQERSTALALLAGRGSPPNNRRQTNRRQRNRRGRSAAGWVLFVFLAVVLFYLLETSPGNGNAAGLRSGTKRDTSSLIALTVFCTGAGCLGVGIIVSLMPSSKPPHDWNGKRIKIDGRGMAITSPGEVHTFKWTFFREFKESLSVFLLLSSSKTGYVIPKRLFSDDGELQRFRELLRANIFPLPDAMPGGFPVIQK